MTPTAPTLDRALCRQPLCDVLPTYYPECADMAAKLTGSSPAVTSAKAMRLLGYEPKWSWRDTVE